MNVIAKERMYLVADKSRVVGEGHPDAAFLYASVGDEIPASAAELFDIEDGTIEGFIPDFDVAVEPAAIVVVADITEDERHAAEDASVSSDATAVGAAAVAAPAGSEAETEAAVNEAAADTAAADVSAPGNAAKAADDGENKERAPAANKGASRRKATDGSD